MARLLFYSTVVHHHLNYLQFMISSTLLEVYRKIENLKIDHGFEESNGCLHHTEAHLQYDRSLSDLN